jgi:RNA polymerase sigma-70 factor (ECF subfamily)
MQTNCNSGKDSFAKLLEENQRDLFRVIFCIVHSLPDAEDVFQQTSVAMWEKFDDFQPGTNFLAWARSIARFKALAFLRSKGRERICFSEELIEQIAAQDALPPAVDEAALLALASCQKKLSSSDQKLLSLCYGGSYTIYEAAESIGRPVGSVYVSLTRIRRALYGCIQRSLSAGSVQ